MGNKRRLGFLPVSCMVGAVFLYSLFGSVGAQDKTAPANREELFKKYYETIFPKAEKKPEHPLAPSNPFWGHMMLCSRRMSGSGKMGGSVRLKVGDTEYLFFSTSRLAGLGNLILGAGEIGTSWLAVIQGDKAVECARVGPIGFDLAGSCIGLLKEKRKMLCLAPDGSFYAFPIPSSSKRQVDIRCLGYLPVKQRLKREYGITPRHVALHAVIGEEGKEFSVVLEVEPKDGPLEMRQLTYSWDVLNHLRPSPKVKRASIPRLFFLGQMPRKDNDVLLGYNVKTNQLEVRAVTGKLLARTSLMVEKDWITYHAGAAFCDQFYFFGMNKDVYKTTFYGDHKDPDLRPLRAKGLFQICRAENVIWCAYPEMTRRTIVLRKYSDGRLGQPHPLPNIEDISDYKLITLGDRLLAVTVELNGSSSNPDGRFHFRSYTYASGKWTRLQDWHTPMPNRAAPGSVAEQPLYFHISRDRRDLIIYTAPSRLVTDIPPIGKIVIPPRPRGQR